MSTSTENTVSLKKLRRLAMRAKSTLEVHSQHPTIALHVSTLPEAADRFMHADDATTTQEALRVAVGKRGYPAVDELRRFMRSYVGVLSRDLAESEAVRLFSHATVSDDVLVQASQLSEIVERLQESGRSLGYAAPLLEGLTARVLSARAEVDETRASLDRVRELQTQRRDAAIALQVELVALRRSLRVALGSRHGDYQRLRVRTQRPDVEDEDALGETTSTAAAATNGRTSAVPATPSNGHTHA